MALLRHHDVIRLRGTSPRKRTRDWLGGPAGGHLCNTRQKMAFFRSPSHRGRNGGASLTLVGTAYAVLTFDGFLPNSAPPTRGFFAFLRRRSGAFQKTWVFVGGWVAWVGWGWRG